MKLNYFIKSMVNEKIKVCIVGVGNCCSALYQGLHYYKNNDDNVPGLSYPTIGGYRLSDIEVVMAVDVDTRKIGKPIGEAIFSLPNCCREFVDRKEITPGPVVMRGPRLDGVSDHMLDEDEDRGFRVNQEENEILLNPVFQSSFIELLKKEKVDILINYLPVGSQLATEFYANCCLEAGVSLLNCIPVFIASDKEWEKKFIEKGIPIIGDDMKSLFGASILSQMFQELAFARGHKVHFHCQTNLGGNTDFNNMMNQSRLKSKKISKENVIKSQNTIRDIEIEKDSIFAGPSSFVPYLKDNKVAHFRLELEGFGGAPVEVDAKLKVCDSENSAGVVIDAIRYLKVAKELGLSGSLKGPSSFTQKTPPLVLSFDDCKRECDAFANRDVTELVKKYNVIK
jgi:myo-inositol-1-phosphate synthase